MSRRFKTFGTCSPDFTGESGNARGKFRANFDNQNETQFRTRARNRGNVTNGVASSVHNSWDAPGNNAATLNAHAATVNSLAGGNCSALGGFAGCDDSAAGL